MEHLEVGHVLEVDNQSLMLIDDDVFVVSGQVGVPVGDLVHRRYFWESVNPENGEIKKIVYLGKSALGVQEYGVRECYSPLDEFLKLSKDTQDNILCEFLQFRRNSQH